MKLITRGTTDSDQLLKENINSLFIEVFRCIHKLNPSFLWEEITLNEKEISKRHGMQLLLPETKIVCYENFVISGKHFVDLPPDEMQVRKCNKVQTRNKVINI